MRREQPRGRGNRMFLSAAIGLVAFSALASLPRMASGGEAREDTLKAGYLFNFMMFVGWPPTDVADVLTVCFLGDSSVYEEMASAVPQKQLGARRLATRQLAANDSLNACQVLYVDAAQLPAVTDVIGTRPAGLLTVSDAPDFLQGGGIVELFDKDNRLRFRISLENARRANLHISSSLLQLASQVEKET